MSCLCCVWCECGVFRVVMLLCSYSVLSVVFSVWCVCVCGVCVCVYAVCV